MEEVLNSSHSLTYIGFLKNNKAKPPCLEMGGL